MDSGALASPGTSSFARHQTTRPRGRTNVPSLLASVRVLPQSPSPEASAASRLLYLRTLRSLLTSHMRAPERKALCRDGSPCGSRTAGLLSPAPIEAYTAVPIGRETNYAEEAGVLDESEYATFPDPNRGRSAQNALAILRARVRHTDECRRIAEALGISEGALRRFLKSGRARAKTRRRAFACAVELAREAVGRFYPSAALPEEPEALLHLAAREPSLMRPTCGGCGAELEGRQRRWCARCRKRPCIRTLISKGLGPAPARPRPSGSRASR